MWDGAVTRDICRRGRLVAHALAAVYRAGAARRHVAYLDDGAPDNDYPVGPNERPEEMTDYRVKPLVPEVAPFVRALYGRCSVGCCLHVVLDDGNLEDDFVRSAVEWAIERGHADCEHLARLMLQMSRTQRRKLGRHTHGPDMRWVQRAT